MDIIVQWATILSPIIAVILAWLTSRSSTKAANKQIAAMKELEKMQINLLQLQLDKDLSDAKIRCSVATKKEHQSNEYNRFSNQIGAFPDTMRHIEERKQDLSSEREYHEERLRWLQVFQKQLDAMKRQIK